MTIYTRNIEAEKNLRKMHEQHMLWHACGNSSFVQKRKLDIGASVDDSEPYSVWSATINTPAIDSYDSIVHPEGVDLSRYQDNPIVYHEHGWMRGDNPIGTATSISPSAEKIDAIWTLGRGYEPANTTQKMMEQGIIRMVSVGFVPKRTGWEKVSAVVNGDAITKEIYHVYEWLMLEFSTTGIGANPEALIHDKKNSGGDSHVLSYPSPQAEAGAMAARIIGLFQKCDKAQRADLLKSASPVLGIYGVSEKDIEDGMRALRVLENVVNAAVDDGSREALMMCGIIDAAMAEQ